MRKNTYILTALSFLYNTDKIEININKVDLYFFTKN